MSKQFTNSVLHKLSQGLVGRKNKQEARELETSEKLKKGMMGTSPERKQGMMGRKRGKWEIPVSKTAKRSKM